MNNNQKQLENWKNVLLNSYTRPTNLINGIFITEDQALEEQNGYPINAYQTIRVKPNDPHGGTASKYGGAFISIQHWLNDVDPTHVSSNWEGNSMGKQHSEQAKLDG